MAPSPDPKPVVTNGIMQPYQGGETIDLAEDSVAPLPPVVPPARIEGSLPPLEVLEVASDFPAVPAQFVARKDEHVVPMSNTVQPLALATDADGPRLATVIEMQKFVERVRGLRTMNPKPGQVLLAVFEEGLDVLSRTERTRLSFGIVSPVAKAEDLHGLAERSFRNLQAVATAAALVYQKPVQELALVFMTHVKNLLKARGTSIQEPYASGKIAEVGEEAYYAMILDSTHLSRVDMERLYGAGEIKKPAEAPEVKKKLTPAEKRARMGLPARKGEAVSTAAEEAVPEVPAEEEKSDPAAEGEYEKELVSTARNEFAELVERVKPEEASEKFKRYGKVKQPPAAVASGQGNSLLDAYAAMSGDAPNFSTLQQAHVYGVAEAMLTWSKGELELLAQLKTELTQDAVAVDLGIASARASKLGEKLPKMQQAEKQNTEAIRLKLAEVARAIAGDAALLAGIKHAWKREIAVLLGEGMEKIIQDEPVISGDSWRMAAKARDVRDAEIRAEQEHLRHNPDDIPGLPTF